MTSRLLALPLDPLTDDADPSEVLAPGVIVSFAGANALIGPKITR